MRPNILKKDATLTWAIRLYNDANVLVDADTTPTVAVRKNGASTADVVTVTKRAATTGIYDCSYNPVGEAEGDLFALEETAVIAAVTYSNVFTVYVAEAERGTDGANTTTPPTATSIATQVWGYAGSRTLTAFNFEVTVAVNNDKLGYGLSSAERLLVAAAMEAAIINELDGTTVIQAIADRIANDMTAGDLSVAAIAAATRNLILGGDASAIVMSAGSVANIGTAQNLANQDWATSGELSLVDARVETLANDQASQFLLLNDLSSVQVQSAVSLALIAYDPPTKTEMDAKIDAGILVDDISLNALRKYVTDDTGLSLAGTGSVGKLSQGAGGGSSGEGDRVVTIIVEDGSSNRVPNAPVNILDASGNPTTLKASTNSSGVVVFNLNDGNYQGLIGATAGFETHTAESFTVSGHGNQTLTLTPTSITPAVAPASVLVAYCVDGSGQPQEGVMVQLRMQKPPNGDTGNAYSHAIREQASVANGLVHFTVIRSATYDIRRQDGNGQWQEIVINDAATHVIDSLVN